MKVYTLGKKEIIRGYRSFENILSTGKRIENDNLSAYIERGIPLVEEKKQDKQYIPVKVGFLLSKKKLKKRTIGTG